LETAAVNCLQNKHHLLKTLLNYRVKYKGLKSCICSTNSWRQSCAELLW